MSVESTEPVPFAREQAPEAHEDSDDPEPEAAAPPSRLAPWLQRLKRPYVWISIVVVVALGVWWFGIRSSGSSSSPTVGVTLTKQLVTVTRGNMSDSVSADGTVAAAQTDNLDFSSAGTVTAVNVQTGDTVQAGEVLATIDSAQLQAAVSSAQSTVASAQAKLSDDESSGASSAQVTADQTSLASANDALTAAQQALAGASLVATFNGTVAQVNVTVGEQLASGGTGGTSTTGSASGSGRSSSSLGSGSSFGGGGSSSSSSSSTSSPQIQVVSTGSYTVSLPVSSNDISNVANGQSVTLTVTTATGNGFGGLGGGFRALFGGGAGLGGGGAAAAARGQNATGSGSGTAAAGGAGRGNGSAAGGATATGTVTSVAKVASASSGVATYPVTVSFNADSTQFYVGATVAGAIATNVRQNVLQVPARAVTTDNGTSTVVVATKGSLSGPMKTVKVTTGATSNGNVEITSGLQEGESVVETVPQFTTTGGGSTSTGGTFRGGFGGGGGGSAATGGAGG